MWGFGLLMALMNERIASPNGYQDQDNPPPLDEFLARINHPDDRNGTW